MKNIKALREDAILIRRKIELIANDDSFLFNPDFPINACKHASQLYCYHMELTGYTAPLDLVFGESNMRNNRIGHWWVESEGILIDITADQFNLIEDNALSYKIKTNRPYLPVYCCYLEHAPHLKVFKPVLKERSTWNIAEISETYIEDLERLYRNFNM